MPFTLAQAPVYFTALMQKVFGQFNDFCFIHICDVSVNDTNENDHLVHLKLIFKRSESKCEFLKRHLQY